MSISKDFQGGGALNLEVILTIVFFVVLISIQYTLNKILSEIKGIRVAIEKNTELGFENEKLKKKI